MQTKIYCLRVAQECVSIDASCWCQEGLSLAVNTGKFAWLCQKYHLLSSSTKRLLCHVGQHHDVNLKERFRDVWTNHAVGHPMTVWVFSSPAAWAELPSWLLLSLSDSFSSWKWGRTFLFWKPNRAGLISHTLLGSDKCVSFSANFLSWH